MSETITIIAVGIAIAGLIRSAQHRCSADGH